MSITPPQASAVPHKVADMSLAEWGRREIELAENPADHKVVFCVCVLLALYSRLHLLCEV